MANKRNFKLVKQIETKEAQFLINLGFRLSLPPFKITAFTWNIFGEASYYFAGIQITLAPHLSNRDRDNYPSVYVEYETGVNGSEYNLQIRKMVEYLEAEQIIRYITPEEMKRNKRQKKEMM